MTPLGNKLGEYITLRGMLCGKRDTLLRLMITSLGIPLISFVEGIDELRWEIGRLRRGRSIRGNWLRITQLYPGGEITFE